MGFYFDQSRCIGCHTCRIACKDWHDIEGASTNWRRVISVEGGKYPRPYLAYLSISCNHCLNPACLKVCPVNAIKKRNEDGIVVVDRKKCLGSDFCGAPCKRACPYHAPQFGDEENAKMQKCDLCLDQLTKNEKPICVNACPMRALDAGPLDELKAKHKGTEEAEGFIFSTEIEPAIFFRSRNKNTHL